MSASSVLARRGRPPAESPQARLARLEKELAAARDAVREARQRKFTLLGEAVAEEARTNTEFLVTVKEILARRVKSAAARAEIEELLNGAA